MEPPMPPVPLPPCYSGCYSPEARERSPGLEGRGGERVSPFPQLNFRCSYRGDMVYTIPGIPGELRVTIWHERDEREGCRYLDCARKFPMPDVLLCCGGRKLAQEVLDALRDETNRRIELLEDYSRAHPLCGRRVVGWEPERYDTYRAVLAPVTASAVA